MNDETKQLYKSYRAAMMTGNLDAAYQQIQNVYEIDPNDDNALAEIIKHQERILSDFTPELQQALSDHNEEQILALLQDIDQLATPHLRAANIPCYHEAKSAEKEIILNEKKALANKLLEELDPTSSQWDIVETHINTIKELLDSYDFKLDTQELKKYTELQYSLKKHNSEVADKQYFDQTLQQLLKIAIEVETISLTNQELPQAQLNQEQEQFIRLWKRIENKKYPIKDADMARLQSATQFYEDAILDYKKAKRTKRVLITSLIIIAFTIASLFGFGYTQADSYSSELQQLQAKGQTQAATKLIAQLEEEHSSLLRFPMLESQVLNTQAWLDKSLKEYEQFEDRLTSLEKNFSELSMSSCALRISGIEASLSKLPQDLKDKDKQKLHEIQNKHQIRVAQARSESLNESNKTLLSLQREIEEIQEQKLSIKELNQASKKLLEILDSKLLEMEANQEVLNIPASTMSQMKELQKTLEKKKSDTQTLLELPTRLATVESLPEFKAAMNTLSDNQTPIGHAAYQLIQRYPSLPMCLSAMFLQGHLSTADAFFQNPSLHLPYPEQASADDLRMLREVSSYKGWVDAYKVQQSKEPRTLWSTKPVDIPKDADWLIALYASPPPFVGRAKNQELSGKSFLSCSLIAVAALPDKVRFFRFLNEKTGYYQESLLYTLPAIAAFQQQGNNALALAYLWKQLANMIQARPREHGAPLSPSLQADLNSFKQTEAETKFPLKSGCWWNTSADAQSAQNTWSKWMQTHSGSTYVKEAKDTLVLMKQISLLGPKVIGYIDAEGQAVLNTQMKSTNPSWYINAKTEKLSPFNPDQAIETVPFSPILSY